jgi:short-subunit dehydrogenase
MTTKLIPIADQVIVITGASSGIGRATAQMAAERGAHVVLAARSSEALSELEDSINSSGGQAISVVADVGKQEDVWRIAEAAKSRFGKIDTWVNNAGVSIYGKLTDVSLTDQRRLFDTNYWGVVYGSLVAAAELKDKGGAIINVGSTISDRALPLQGAYSASKHAVKGFTDAFRMELEHDNTPISVTLIKPGAINTPYIEHAKNYMEVEPTLPPPVYAPEVVAEAILYAAENPVRDLFAGGAGKAISMAGHYAPRLTDKVFERWGFETQKTEIPNMNPEDKGLHKPSGGGQTRGSYDGHVSESSLYTKSSMHPFVTGGLLLAGVGLAFALAKTRDSKSSAEDNSAVIGRRNPRRRTSQARSQPVPTA